MKCKVCQSETSFFSKAIVLGKYDVDYYQCQRCRFVQTEEPYWLEEAYTQPINQSDYGYVARNIICAKLTLRVITNLLDYKADFLDYGSGYGLLVRFMRDTGLNFYAYDTFCENIFSPQFDVSKSLKGQQYEMITAFEVFEHLPNPREVLQEILSHSKNLLFSTVLLPESNPKPTEWSYYIPHEGQHISFFTYESLQEIAQFFGLNLYTNRNSVHLLTEHLIPSDALEVLGFIEYDTSRAFEEVKNTFLRDIKVDQLLRNEIAKDIADNSPYQRVDEGKFKIIIDGVFFQLYNTGIARVWKTLLEEWSGTDFADHIVVLDRADTAPKVHGIKYRSVPAYQYDLVNNDRAMLQNVCDEENASLFVSTYYTTPVSTPSAFMAYDMIPEVMGWDLNHPMWVEKHNAIQQASAYLSISQNTANDLAKFFPHINAKQVNVAHCGVSEAFRPAPSSDITSFKAKYGITKPYFIIVGAGSGANSYKNAALFFEAFANLPTKAGFEVLCTGPSTLDDSFRDATFGTQLHTLQLSDEELIIAYSGAIALVYPSKYEGFGLPIIEAMACGCPVITSRNGSIPEVAGDAAMYVDDSQATEMATALCDIQKPAVRQSLISSGRAQIQQFSWASMAEKVQTSLLTATLPFELGTANLLVFPDWELEEEAYGEALQNIIRELCQLPSAEQITLLIDNNGIDDDNIDMLLQSIAMNLVLTEDINLESGPNIIVTGQLTDTQWKVLINHVQGRVAIDAENTMRVEEVGAQQLASESVEKVSSLVPLQ